MEVDHISYIFGSFTRRRQSQGVGIRRRSINTPKIFHDRSNSAPHTSNATEGFSANRAKSSCNFQQDESKFKCSVCGIFFIEPRVLPCLHTFCTRCLQEMEANDDGANWNANGSDVSISIKTDSSSPRHGSGSGGSGYDSDHPNILVIPESPQEKSIKCPLCETRSVVPKEGILGFPPHYLLQHRMVLATLNSCSTRLLCDICSTDIPALFRCTECAISFCQVCAETHRRQRNFSRHEILHLDEARRKGINTVRRQVMCVNHPERELELFCSTCCQVICHDCISGFHKGHTCQSVSRAAKSFTKSMKETLEKTQFVAKQATGMSLRLQGDSHRVQHRCNQIQEEVATFMRSYIRAVEEHHKNLDYQINRAREEKLKDIEVQKIEVHKRLKEVSDVVVFANELLTEGTDVEVLSFVKPILRKLERYSKCEPLNEFKVAENLQFLPEEALVPNSENFCRLYGVITTQSISPNHCVLNLQDIQNLRVGRKIEAKIETYDSHNSPLQRGGEKLVIELRHHNRDSGASRSVLFRIEDLHDGTYILSFTPDASGKLLLSIFIKGQPIKNSPFTFTVRNMRPHRGVFHCCSFCSSAGNKEAACGCGGTMPGGYRGCGHGHEGHPGKRHWSCCGNIMEHSECVRANSTHYQFTL